MSNEARGVAILILLFVAVAIVFVLSAGGLLSITLANDLGTDCDDCVYIVRYQYRDGNRYDARNWKGNWEGAGGNYDCLGDMPNYYEFRSGYYYYSNGTEIGTSPYANGKHVCSEVSGSCTYWRYSISSAPVVYGEGFVSRFVNYKPIQHPECVDSIKTLLEKNGANPNDLFYVCDNGSISVEECAGTPTTVDEIENKQQEAGFFEKVLERVMKWIHGLF